MKTLLLSLFIALSPLISRADYGGYYFAFEASHHSGEKTAGFLFISINAYLHLDSLDNSDYLIGCFDRSDWKLNDTIQYAKTLVKYPVLYENYADTVYYYTGIRQSTLPTKDIASIKITDQIEYGSMSFLQVMDTAGTTDWLYKRPVEEVHLIGLLCEASFHVHQQTEKTKAVLKEIRAILQMETSEEEAQEIDKQIDEFIEQLKGEKVVVSGSCSC